MSAKANSGAISDVKERPGMTLQAGPPDRIYTAGRDRASGEGLRNRWKPSPIMGDAGSDLTDRTISIPRSTSKASPSQPVALTLWIVSAPSSGAVCANADDGCQERERPSPASAVHAMRQKVGSSRVGRAGRAMDMGSLFLFGGRLARRIAGGSSRLHANSGYHCPAGRVAPVLHRIIRLLALCSRDAGRSL